MAEVTKPTRASRSTRRRGDPTAGEENDEPSTNRPRVNAAMSRARNKSASRAGRGSPAVQGFVAPEMHCEFRELDPIVSFDFAESAVVKEMELVKIQERIGEDTRRLLVGDLVRLLLLRGARRLPITRDDIRQELLQGEEHKQIRAVRGLVNFLLQRAHEYLHRVLGYKLVDGAWVDLKFAGSFFVVNALPVKEDDSFEHHVGSVQHGAGVTSTIAEKGILMATLAVVLHGGGDGVVESKLIENLGELDDAIPSRALRGVDSRLSVLLDTWTRQKFLSREKKDWHGDLATFYTLGPRAIAEVGRPSILSFVFNCQNQRVDERMLEAMRDEFDGFEETTA